MSDDSIGTDALSIDDSVLDHIPLERLELQITSYAGRLAAAQARWLVWIGAYDRREGWQQWQAKSCAHWLNWRCGMSMRTAREHVRVARRLEELPVVRERFLSGALSYSKVRAVSRVATEFNETDLVELAELSTASQVERLCGGLRRAQSLRDEATQAEDAVANQFVGYANNHDGTATITITAPVADAKVAHAALVEAASSQIEAARRPGQPAAEVVDELGGLGRIRAETAVAILAGMLTATAGRTEDVLVVVDHDELTDADRAEPAPGGGAHDCSCERTCTIDGERISPLVARRLACDARLQLAIEDAVGDALGIGRASMVVPRWLRRQLKRRDHGMCQFPGCCATRRLHAHHIIH
ncbi:MAG: 13E12 repeat family protein, partial [Deltaproteobacteria bacterium]|nr:13E12 repeat family protein [Deltaproteobacteria bacterium]